MHINGRENKKKLFFLCVLIVLITSVSPITFGIYYSCLPQISEFFTNNILFHHQLIFLPYIFGLVISQIIYGPLSDFYGRKPIILIGLSIFIIGSVFNFMSNSLTIFIVSRIIQGIGIGYTNPICRALQRDLFNKGSKYFIYGSYIAMALSLIAMFSPIIGSYILKVYSKNFYANIFFIVIYALCTYFIVLLLMPETNNNRVLHYFSLSECYIRYLKIFKNYHFLRLSVCGGLFYAAEITYCSLSSVIFQVELQWSLIQYGFRTLVIMSGFFLGCFISSQLNKFFSFYNNIFFGFIILLFSESTALCLLLVDRLSTCILIFTMWLFMLASGIISSNISLRAVSLFKNDLGFVSSSYCSLQFLLGFIVIMITYILNIHSLYNMILFLLIIALITFVYLFCSVSIKSKKCAINSIEKIKKLTTHIVK